MYESVFAGRGKNLLYKDISGVLKISAGTVERRTIKTLQSINGNLNLYI